MKQRKRKRHFDAAMFGRAVRKRRGDEPLRTFAPTIDMHFTSLGRIERGCPGLQVSTFLHLCFVLDLQPGLYWRPT
jgi:hypothetical protein